MSESTGVGCAVFFTEPTQCPEHTGRIRRAIERSILAIGAAADGHFSIPLQGYPEDRIISLDPPTVVIGGVFIQVRPSVEREGDPPC